MRDAKCIALVIKLKRTGFKYFLRDAEIYRRLFIKKYGYNMRQLKKNQPQLFPQIYLNDLRINKQK